MALHRLISATNRGYCAGVGTGEQGLGQICFSFNEPCDGILRNRRYGEVEPSP